LQEPGNPAVEWRTSDSLVPYPEALALMEQRVAGIRDRGEPELVWLLEHPPLYTAGTSAAADELLDPTRFPVYVAGRGGRYTYHGPGQRVVYVQLDLKRRGGDIRRYVHQLEELAIRTLDGFGIRGERRAGRVGIWVVQPDGSEAKIGAIGVRVRRWVSFHGLAINLCPQLDHFRGIVPCGISEHGVTSLHALGVQIGFRELDDGLRRSFVQVFEKE
jgi:lipoyl(octanoyl) transferase